MRPTGPQGLIRRRFRIRARAGWAEAPGAIARLSRRIDISTLCIAFPRSPGMVNRALPRERRDGGVLADNRAAMQGANMSARMTISAAILLAGQGLLATQGCGRAKLRHGAQRVSRDRRGPKPRWVTSRRRPIRRARRARAHRRPVPLRPEHRSARSPAGAAAADADSAKHDPESRNRFRKDHAQHSRVEHLLEIIAPDIAADGLVGLRGRRLLAHQPVSGLAIERERGLLQLGRAERQHRRARVAARPPRRARASRAQARCRETPCRHTCGAARRTACRDLRGRTCRRACRRHARRRTRPASPRNSPRAGRSPRPATARYSSRTPRAIPAAQVRGSPG